MTKEACLTPDHWRVLVILHAFEHGKEKTAFPSLHRLANDLQCSVRTVQRRLADLEAGKLLTRIPRYGNNGRQTSSVFRLSPTAFAVGSRKKKQTSVSRSITKEDSVLSRPSAARGEDDVAISQTVLLNAGSSGTSDNLPPDNCHPGNDTTEVVNHCDAFINATKSVTPLTLFKTKEGDDTQPVTTVCPAPIISLSPSGENIAVSETIESVLTTSKVRAVGEWLSHLDPYIEKIGEPSVVAIFRKQGSIYTHCFWREAAPRLIPQLDVEVKKTSIVSKNSENLEKSTAEEQERGKLIAAKAELAKHNISITDEKTKEMAISAKHFHDPVDVISRSWWAQDDIVDGSRCETLFYNTSVQHLATKVSVRIAANKTIIATPFGIFNPVYKAFAKNNYVNVVLDTTLQEESGLNEGEAINFIKMLSDQEVINIIFKGSLLPSVISKLQQWKVSYKKKVS